ncbi:MAG: hypothetical protein ACOCP2_02590 [Halohasta sp.]
MSQPDRATDPAEEMLPDERAVIADRAVDLDELDEDEFRSVEELASELGFERSE